MSYEPHYQKKARELMFTSRFKRKFLDLWEEHGEYININGRKSFKNYKISGDSVGAIAMSKLLGSPTLHNDIEDSHISRTDIILNFSKIVDIDNEAKFGWLNEYRGEMETLDFNKLYYKIYKNQVVSACFVKVVDDIETALTNGPSLQFILYPIVKTTKKKSLFHQPMTP